MGLNHTKRVDKYEWLNTTGILNDTFKELACGIYHTLALDSSGRVWSFGFNTRGQLGLPNTIRQVMYPERLSVITKPVISIVAASSYSYVQTNDFKWTVFGHNEQGYCYCNQFD